MFPPWFLFSILFTLAHAFSVSRHPTDGSGSLENPTCEELQEFWRLLKQTMNADAAETNEISVMPPKILDRILMETSRNGKHSKTHTKYSKDALSNRFSINPFTKDFSVIQTPALPNFLLPKSRMPSKPEGIGIFGEFHDQLDQPIPPNHHRIYPGSGSSSSAASLGDQKYDEGEYFVPQWSSPSEEVGTFGSFVDFDAASPHLARTPKDDTMAEWADLPTTVNCDVLMNSDCTVNEQCLCKEKWQRIQCIHGKCLNYHQNDDNLEKYGTWHDGPIPQLQLRLLAMPRAKRYRSIFM